MPMKKQLKNLKNNMYQYRTDEEKALFILCTKLIWERNAINYIQTL